MIDARIYHGTPMTPRAALKDVCAGRAMCVSFFRPDDVEVVEAISPAVMFRQWGVFTLEKSHARWPRMARKMGLAGILRLAGGAVVSSWQVGCDSRYAWCAVTAQRCTDKRLAVRSKGCAALAHGWAYRPLAETVRQVRPRLLGMDRQRQGDQLPRISGSHGGSRSGTWEPLAGNSHDARGSCCWTLSVWQRGLDQPCTERMEI